MELVLNISCLTKVCLNIDVMTDGCLCALRYLDVEPNSLNSLRAYLASGAIPGVGEKTAQYMVDGLGENVIDILNGPNAVSALTRCAKIGKLTASKIKQSWDAGRGKCPTPAFDGQAAPSPGMPSVLTAADARRHTAERAVPAATWVDGRPGTAGGQSARRAHGSSCARGSIPRHAGRSCHLWVSVSPCQAELQSIGGVFASRCKLSCCVQRCGSACGAVSNTCRTAQSRRSCSASRANIGNGSEWAHISVVGTAAACRCGHAPAHGYAGSAVVSDFEQMA